MPNTFTEEVRQQLARYLAGELSLRDFRRWLVPVSWEAEEHIEDDPKLADYVGRIDLRLMEHADGYWTEDQLRGLLGPFILERSAELPPKRVAPSRKPGHKRT